MDESTLKSPQPLDDEERRVLGVLIEKSLTTPDAYPMTINAIVAGCNQKLNRSPQVNYDPDDVEQTLDRLRERDLVNVVITGGGRVERYRQLSRLMYGWNEEQIAIMAELLLRGRQSCGELRSRASRMKSIESLERLRSQLRELTEAGHARASGPLQQRGVEVDHALYDGATPSMPQTPTDPPAVPPVAKQISAPAAPIVAESASSGAAAESESIQRLEVEVAELRTLVQKLRDEVDSLQQRLDSVL